MADREKQGKDDRENDTGDRRFDPWEAEFNRDLRQNDREFDF